MKEIPADLLAEHLETFLGYGNTEANVWFVGPEQGGGHTLEEIGNRIAAWESLGKRRLVDLREYHAIIGESRWFAPNPKIQSTWGKLARAYLAFKGEQISTESVRQFQAEELGATNGDTSLIELMPLPSATMGHWIFKSVETVPYLSTRERYVEALLPLRKEAVRSAISAANPDVVLFFGLQYANHWEAIIGQPVRRNGDGFGVVSSGTTKYAIAPHPVSHGVTNAAFENFGRQLANRLGPER